MQNQPNAGHSHVRQQAGTQNSLSIGGEDSLINGELTNPGRSFGD
jgi:hypothetical protein